MNDVQVALWAGACVLAVLLVFLTVTAWIIYNRPRHPSQRVIVSVHQVASLVRHDPIKWGDGMIAACGAAIQPGPAGELLLATRPEYTNCQQCLEHRIGM